MTFSISLLLFSLAAAFVGGLIYTIIGIIPGTDETATMVPVTLVLVLMGLPPVVLYSWVIGQIVAMQISHTIPTAMAALPGSTMAAPMVSYCSTAKMLGIPHVAMRKMAAGSLVGSFVSVPIAILISFLLSSFGEALQPHIGLIFTIGAAIIAFISSSKWAGVIALVPFAFLIQGMQRLAVEAVGHTLFISIFMGITIGPMISELFSLFAPPIRATKLTNEKTKIWVAPETKENFSLYPNPFKILTKEQCFSTVIASTISSLGFTLSPVGMTVLTGESEAGRKKELYDRVTSTVAIQDATSNATYIAGLIIPLLAFGLPLSPVAMGPCIPLFNAPPRFTIEPINNLHNYMQALDVFVYGILAILAGSVVAYPMAIHKARSWTEKMFRLVSHEALIGAFVGLIFMLSYYEAGVIGIVIALVVGLIGGMLNSMFEVHTGIQFMGFYASSYIVTQLLTLGKFL